MVQLYGYFPPSFTNLIYINLRIANATFHLLVFIMQGLQSDLQFYGMHCHV